MPKRRLLRFHVVAVTLLIVLSGCTGGSGPEKSITSTKNGPLVDSAPYWCDVIPQQALRDLSGITVALKETSSGLSHEHGGCGLFSGYTRSSLEWSMERSKHILDIAITNFERHKLADLPPDLGTGLIAYTGQPVSVFPPYYTMMVFTCGKKRPWISIDLSEIAEGRDPVKGLTELLRIARARFGVVHGCTPSA